MYTIVYFNMSNGEITFMSTENGKKHVINVLQYDDYRRVSPQHYYNMEHNEVIMFDGPVSFRSFVTSSLIPSIEDKGKIYYPCKQWQFDKWHINTSPNSHNAKVYNLLKEALN